MRIAPCLMFAVVLWGALPATGQDQWLKKRFMPKLDAAFKVGDRKVPIDDLSLPLVVTNVNGDWLWVGKAWVQKKHVVALDAASGYYTSQIRRNPRDASAFHLRAITRGRNPLAAFDEELRAEALEDYAAAIRLAPNDYMAIHNRASFLSNPDFDAEFFMADEEDVETAFADLNRALQLNRQHGPSWFLRGLIWWWQKNDRQKALNDIHHAIQLGLPADVEFDAYWSRGRLFAELKRYDEAIEDFSLLIKRKPGAWGAYKERGLVQLEKKDFDKAISDFDQVIKAAPKLEDGYEARGDARWLKGELEEAKADYAEVLRIEPKRPEELRQAGASLANGGSFEQAIAFYDRAIRIDDTYARVYSDRGWLLATCPDEKIRNGKQAVASATRACELTDWKSPVHLETLAAAHAEAGDFDEAVRWQEKAAELAPDDRKKQYQTMLELFKSNKPYRQQAKKK